MQIIKYISSFRRRPSWSNRLNSIQALATNVHGVIVPLSGHWIPEEQSDFVVDQIFNFFGSSNK
ncbi:MAG TPA: hypothetical protein VIP56_11240 [Nitrososphaeraceae archaeon]